MVPMRGLKFKFAEGEKVLCYEPDPTKARVLYDSKVLEVNVNKDKKGRKAVEYLIHFQGWNSSWDRYVSEDHILKHTEENWKLQKELAEKAQLRPTAYLYRRDLKGHKGKESSYRVSSKAEHCVNRCTSSTTTSREGSPSSHSSYSTVLDKDECNRNKSITEHGKKSDKSVMEDEHLPNAYEGVNDSDGDIFVKHEIDSGDSGAAHSDEEEEDDECHAAVEDGIDGDGAGDQDSEDFGDNNNTDNSDCSTEGEESGDDVSQSEEGAQDHAEEENFPLEFTDVMRDILDLDNERIKNANKLIVLPANPNVVTILESYVREYAINQICGAPDNSRRKYRRRHNHQNGPLDVERINRSINMCKEVADGVRVYFDFTLSGLLLYNEEKEQYEQTQSIDLKKEPDSRVCAVDEKDGESTRLHQSCVSYSCEPSTSHLDEVSCDNKCVTANNFKRLPRNHCHTNVEGKDYAPLGTTDSDNRESEKSLAKNTDSSAINGSFLSLVIPKKESLSVEHDNVSSNSLKYKSPTSMPNIPSVEDMLHSRGCPPAAMKFLLSQVLEWRLVPDSLYSERPLPPCLIYGAVHLARLFVKLPGLLHNTDMQVRKLKLVLRHLQMILRYLEQNRSWFGEEFYHSKSEEKME